MLVAGLDGCKSGVGVLDEGRFARAGLFSRAEDVLIRWSAVQVIAIDIPIGLPDASTDYRRDADTAARAFLKGSASSVFSTPPRELLEAPDHASAVAKMTCEALLPLEWRPYSDHAPIVVTFRQAGSHG